VPHWTQFGIHSVLGPEPRESFGHSARVPDPESDRNFGFVHFGVFGGEGADLFPPDPNALSFRPATAGLSEAGGAGDTGSVTMEIVPSFPEELFENCNASSAPLCPADDHKDLPVAAAGAHVFATGFLTIISVPWYIMVNG
jgi:hypothetical protein